MPMSPVANGDKATTRAAPRMRMMSAARSWLVSRMAMGLDNRSPATLFLGLPRQERSPAAIQGCPEEVVGIHHAQREGAGAGHGRGGGGGAERYQRLGAVERTREQLRARAAAVDGGAVEPAGACIEPDGALAADLRGIHVLGPLQAEIVEHRLDHAGARGIGGAVEVAGEAHLDVPASHEVAQDAAGRLDARLSGGTGGATCLGPALGPAPRPPRR